MPLYEYECPKDGVFELVRKFSDPPLSACPKCSGPIEKLASAPAIQFKGTGWYVTDYARKGKGDDGGSAKSDKAAAKSESESKSDKSKSDKSESKSESKDSSSGRSTDSGSSSTPTSGTGSSTDKK